MHEALSYRLGSKRDAVAGDATVGEESEDKEGRATARMGEGGEGAGREKGGGGVAAEGGAQIRKIKKKKADRQIDTWRWGKRALLARGPLRFERMVGGLLISGRWSSLGV